MDFVLDHAHQYIPIEVKWSDAPNISHIKHLQKFIQEYPETQQAYVVCRTPRRYKLAENITVLPWQEVSWVFQNL